MPTFTCLPQRTRLRWRNSWFLPIQHFSIVLSCLSSISCAFCTKPLCPHSDFDLFSKHITLLGKLPKIFDKLLLLSPVLLIPPKWPMWQSSPALSTPQAPADLDWPSSRGGGKPCHLILVLNMTRHYLSALSSFPLKEQYQCFNTFYACTSNNKPCFSFWVHFKYLCGNYYSLLISVSTGSKLS